MKEAIILAGGFGTRLKSIVSDVPKPMAPVNEQPFLTYLLRYLSYYGIQRIILSTGYQEEKIREFFGESAFGMQINYSHESEPLGTGGAISLAMEKCSSKEVLVLNGDSFFDVDLNDFYQKHSESKAEHSLALRYVENASRYGAIETEENRLISFKEKSEEQREGLINGGIYILNKELYQQLNQDKKTFSIEKDFFEQVLTLQKIYGFPFDGQFIDIGTPEDYIRAQHEFKEFKY